MTTHQEQFRRLAGMVSIRALRDAGAPTETLALKTVSKWLATDQTGLLVCGGVGTGKTTAAVYALRFAIECGETSFDFASADTLARLGYWGTQRTPTEERLCELRAVRLLVLDDLGAELLNEPWLGNLASVLDARFGNFKKTLITTNLPPAAIEARYGARIYDRMRQSCTMTSVGSISLRKPENG